MTQKPRRRIVMTASIEADSWDDLCHHLRHITPHMEFHASRRRSMSSGSSCGGSAHMFTIEEDDSVTNDSRIAAKDARRAARPA